MWLGYQNWQQQPLTGEANRSDDDELVFSNLQKYWYLKIAILRASFHSNVTNCLKMSYISSFLSILDVIQDFFLWNYEYVIKLRGVVPKAALDQKINIWRSLSANIPLAITGRKATFYDYTEWFYKFFITQIIQTMLEQYNFYAYKKTTCYYIISMAKRKIVLGICNAVICRARKV